MMKGGKGEGKNNTEPLFPRLHVNDREKGGPRAPPRNKMALYEQFSIPSQRFNSSGAAAPGLISSHKASASSSQDQLRPKESLFGKYYGLFCCWSYGLFGIFQPALYFFDLYHGKRLVFSNPDYCLYSFLYAFKFSHGQGYCQERSVFAPSDVPTQPSIHLAKRVCFRSSNSTSLSSTRAEFVGTSKRHSINGISNATGSAGNSLQLPGSSNAKQSRQKNCDDEDDFMVPTFVQTRASPVSNKHLSAIESEIITTSHIRNPKKSSSSLSPNSVGKSLKGTFTNNERLRNIEQNHNEQRQTAQPVNKDPKRIPDCGRRLAELSSFAKASSNQDVAGTATVAGAGGYDNVEVHPEYSSNVAVEGDRCIGTDVASKGHSSRVGKELCSGDSYRNHQVQTTEAVKFNQESKSKADGSPELEDVDKNEVFEASLPDSISGMVICPDDVVGVIGPKHFWKARRAIVNQQRVFAIQVFELHRLIKVQKSLAAYPDVLKVDVYFSESPIEVPTMVIPPENFEKSHQPTVAEEASSQKQTESKECPEAVTMQDPPASQTPINGPSPFSSTADNRLNPWCIQPPQNQWLVPVMSPSEGLIYKPYPGPCPPTASFLPPFYGGYAPPVSVDFTNPAFGALSYPQQPPIYFPAPPYGLHVTKQIMSSSTVEQVSPPLDVQPAKPDMQQSRGSCSVANTGSDAISGQLQKPQASRGREAQGSILTIPGENAQGGVKDAMVSFPAPQDSNGTKPPSEPADKSSENRVIRVVPHNARLATESAARIFRFIQQERKKYDL